MKRRSSKDSLFWIFLGIFGLAATISLALMFLNAPKSYARLPNKKNSPGVFRIEGPEEIGVNTNTKVKFIANSRNQAVNAVKLSITFDPSKLEILNIDTSQSFCQFYPENKFNNDKGTISIACGAPNPGFKGENTIAVVTFFSKNMGDTALEVTDKSQILLNDGKGTNIFNAPILHRFLILNNL